MRQAMGRSTAKLIMGAATMGAMTLGALGARTANAASPFGFSYGGRLANASDEAETGPVTLEVKFYTQATGGAPIGVSSIVKSGVPLDDGVFQIDFTELTPEELHLVFADGAAPWIEITDKTHSKTYPRQMLVAVPYALKVPVDGKSVAFDAQGRLKVGPSTNASAGQFLTQNTAGNWTWGTPSTSSQINKAGDTNVGSLSFGAQATLGLGTFSSSQESTLSAALTSTDKGKTWYNTTDNQMRYWDGSAVQSLGGAGAGVVTLNGLTGSAQSFAVGTSGTGPSWNSASGTHTLNLPMASASSVTGGLISKANFDTFNSKQDAITTSTTLSTGSLTSNQQNGVELAPWGTTTGKTGEARFRELSANGTNYVGFRSADSIAGNVVWTLPPSDGTNGQVLSTNGAGMLSWANASSGSAVTSIAGMTGAVTLNTDDVTEGTNFYYTDSRARSAFSALSPLAYSPSTGQFSLPVATTTTAGYLASADFTTFNNAASTVNAATSSNTASKLVQRDASGNFAANVITANLSGNATNVTGIVSPGNGGTGLGTMPSNGKIPIGNGSGYQLANITAGTGIDVTNGPGSIVISALGDSNKLNRTGDSMTGQLTLAPGTMSTPALGFSNGSGTGLYSPANGALAFATGGIQRMYLDPSGQVDVAGPFRFAGSLTTAGYSIQSGTYPITYEFVVFMNCSTSCYATLPDATLSGGRIIIVKNTSTNASVVTVKSQFGNIDGTISSTGIPLSTQYSGKMFMSNGSQWLVIGSF